LDIYPLYLFLNGGITLNAALDLPARVTLTARDDDRVLIRSLDTRQQLAVEGGVAALPSAGPLALVTRVLRHYAPPGGLEVVTDLAPPHGSGLGASSALFIALSHAVLAYMGRARDAAHIIRVSNHLEAQLMGTPAGTQDYYPPSYGGINAMHYTLEREWHEPLDPAGTLAATLDRHLVVSYSNITHHSGVTNWGMMRNFLDDVPETVAGLHRIKETADAMYRALHAGDVRETARLLDEEWGNRRQLSADVSNSVIERMMAAAAAAGAWASKVCGAGGGGCLITLAPEAARPAVIAALEAAGGSHLPAHLIPGGVAVAVQD
jgi:D-glycero-alpha-D-manno-heptose-7-phosphate kinase